jgi:hypothetical protein
MEHFHLAEELSPARSRVFPEIGSRAEQHCVRESDEAGRGAKLRDQNRGIFDVLLPRLDQPVGSDGERASSDPVQQSAEERWRVEPRHAHPGDPTVSSNQGCAATVADQTVTLDGQVAGESLDLTEASVRFEFSGCHQELSGRLARPRTFTSKI